MKTKTEFNLSGVYIYPNGSDHLKIEDPYICVNVATRQIDTRTNKPVTGSGVMLFIYGFYEKDSIFGLSLGNAVSDALLQLRTLPGLDLSKFNQLLEQAIEREAN